MDVDPRIQAWIVGPEGQLWIAYQQGSQRLELAVEETLRRTVGISHPEYEILSRLAAAPDHRLRMGALAALMISPKSRLNYQVTQLANRGLLVREPCPDDRRGLFAVLTETGEQIFLQAVPALIETIRRVVIDPLRPEDRLRLKAIMETISDTISPTHLEQ